MADDNLKKDPNFITTIGAVDNTSAKEVVNLQADSITKRLLVDSTVEAVGHGTVGDGTKTLGVAGTRVQLSTSSVPCKRIFVQSHESNGSLTNGGLVVVGGVTVVATTGTRRGYALYPTQGEWFTITNLNLLYVDSVDASAVVVYFYEV